MILVTGATGSNGAEIVTRLAARHVPVRAMVRHPGQASVIALPHVELMGGTLIAPRHSSLEHTDLGAGQDFG